MLRCVLHVIVAATLATGCSQVLGFKEPTVEDDTPGQDASVDSSPDSPSVCVPSACPFGCDSTSNMCREGKLWIFKTSGQFLGNAFGGTDNPPNVRGGADARCLTTYNANATYMSRQCNPNRMRAVLHIDNVDSLSLMATRFSIPTAVPVHRAEDDVLVSNNWNDLTDPTKALRAAATTAPTDADGLVWTGTNTVATCGNWRSAVSTDMGTRGYTNRVNAGWLNQDTFRCDRLMSLLCVCWAGGQ